MGMVVGAANSFLKLTYGEVKNKFANCSNVSVKFVTANNSADTYSAAVNALTAQGHDAIITDVQFGDQSLRALNGQGNIVFLGGLPAAPLSRNEYASLNEELRVKAPGIKFLTDAAVTTNWDPAQEQRAVAGLISKYPKIDAVVSDYGGATMGAVRAFQAAGLPVPPVATTASTNEFGCAIADIRKTSPTSSSSRSTASFGFQPSPQRRPSLL
jgi:ribose transport system substrate-binding protein